MYTRKDYLDGKCTHREYYAQFVDERIKKIVRGGIGILNIRNSEDESFNDINLKKWDALTVWLGNDTVKKLKEVGDCLSIAGGVCILKEAARQIKEE